MMKRIEFAELFLATGAASLIVLLLSGSAGAAPFAYITNSGSNNVSVIDTATNTVTASVNVGSNPYGVAVNPAGTKVYVVNDGSYTVSVIDTATNTVTASVNVGLSSQGVGVNPAGTKVYVANSNSGTVSVIDTATNTVTASVNVGNTPYGVAVNPAGTKVYVANRDSSNSVSVIDTATNTVTASVNVGSNPVAFGQFIGPAIGTGAPNIISWGNSKTNNASLNLTINTSEVVQFNATANQTITTWNWYNDNILTSNTTNTSNFSWSTAGSHRIDLNATNANGTSGTITWNVTVASPGAPPTYVPPTPVNLTNTSGSYRVNYTWQAGTGNTTDSYNVSVNGTWTNGSSRTWINTTTTPSGWVNITIFAFNSSGTGTLNSTGISQNTQVPAAPTPASTTPPTPVNLTNTSGSYWVNYTWQAGVGNITNSYNVSVNGTWTNGSSQTWINTTTTPSGWVNITVYAFNSSGPCTLNQTGVSQNTQAPAAPTPTQTPTPTPTQSSGGSSSGYYAPVTATATATPAATASVTATPPVPKLTVIKVSPSNASVVVGKNQTFTASATDQFGNPITVEVSWSSSNNSVGTIDTAGVFTGAAPGNATITARSGDVSGTATVTVTPAMGYRLWLVTPIGFSALYQEKGIANSATSVFSRAEGNYNISLNLYDSGVGGGYGANGYKLYLVPAQARNIYQEKRYKMSFIVNPTTSGFSKAKGNYKISLNLYDSGVGGGYSGKGYKLYLVPVQAYISYSNGITVNDPTITQIKLSLLDYISGKVGNLIEKAVNSIKSVTSKFT